MREKAEALAALEERKKNRPKKIDNASLYAGSPMYYYCRVCGSLAAVLPETHNEIPPRLCPLCEELKEKGWLES